MPAGKTVCPRRVKTEERFGTVAVKDRLQNLACSFGAQGRDREENRLVSTSCFLQPPEKEKSQRHHQPFVSKPGEGDHRALSPRGGPLLCLLANRRIEAAHRADGNCERHDDEYKERESCDEITASPQPHTDDLRICKVGLRPATLASRLTLIFKPRRSRVQFGLALDLVAFLVAVLRVDRLFPWLLIRGRFSGRLVFHAFIMRLNRSPAAASV